MSEEQRMDEENEVEAHRTGIKANDEPRDEAETDDEVEAHLGHYSKPGFSKPTFS